jgi:hypothetical protein
VVLNKVMSFYEQIKVIPFFCACMLILFTLTGLFIFDEIQNYTAASFLMVLLGVGFCLVGVAMIATRE